MFTGTVENTSPKRQRVNESQSVHSLALRACKGAKHGAVQLRMRNFKADASGHENSLVLGLLIGGRHEGRSVKTDASGHDSNSTSSA
jgi:hypothetical protein